MSNERDELADVLWDLAIRHLGVATSSSKHMADELIEAGYRKSRTITTPFEIDALPDGTSILWGGKVYGAARTHRRGRPYWFRPGRVGSTVVTPSIDYPATVLHEPEATK